MHSEINGSSLTKQSCYLSKKLSCFLFTLVQKASMYDLISIFTENNILLHVNQKLSQNRILTAFFDIFYTASDQTTL